MGGSETDPGIFINWSLRLGTTASRCITFNKFWPISRDLVFDIRILELWVVNEVFMKNRQISKRDFYSTVVMWNRIGRHKAKEDKRRTDRTDCCCHNEINTLSNDNRCSHEEIHETDERHFEPSNTSLTGDNNIDDELLIAIKNRLAGVPPMPGALRLKPEAKLQVINRGLPMTSTKPQYLANRQPSKPKKGPTQVSTQVDDNMIIELKSQGTSTSQLKVSSRCTPSGMGLASQMEGTAAQLRHSTSRVQRADERYQRSLPQERNAHLYPIPSRTLQSDEQNQRPLQPRRNSFPNHTKHRLPSPGAVSPRTNYVDPPTEDSVIRNSIQSANQYSLPDPSVQSDRHSLGLPEVPDFYGMSSQRPSVTRNIRSSIDEASYNQQIHELSWSNRNNTGAILPYQQQLVRAATNRGDPYEDTNQKPPSQSRSNLRDGSREVNQEHSPTGIRPYQEHNSSNRSIRSIESYHESSRYQDHQPHTRSIREVNSYRGHYQLSQYQDHPPPSKSIRENESIQRNAQNRDNSPNENLREVGDRGSPISQDHPETRSNVGEELTKDLRVRLDPALTDQRESPLTEEQTVLTVTTQQVESGQLCRCGSKELKLVCGCKKSALKEVGITKTGEGFRECRCPRKNGSEEDMSKNKKKKKGKKGKADKEAKAEEKRRKKEEKERKKREMARQKAREKEERKKSKSKGRKKSKNKGAKELMMCSCCKCRGDEGETTIVLSETSRNSEEKSKKKSKKEKKSKEKKEKKQKGKNKGNTDEYSNDPPRSCNCPPTSKTQLNDCCRLSTHSTRVQIQQDQVQDQQLTIEEPSALGFCNHPDVPCPALGNREMSQVRVQNRKSVVIPPNTASYCGDPVCTNAKQIKQNEMSRTYSFGEASKTFRSCCCCAKTSGGCGVNVCSYAANVEQPAVYRASTSMRGNSPSAQIRTSQSPPRTSPTSSVNADSTRYRDITAAPALIFPDEVGHGDTVEVLPHLRMSTTDPRSSRSTPLPNGFSSPENVLIDLSRRGRGNSTNKRYVPPCVLYLDCTKVKDLCVIIKDKYEDPF